MKLFPSSIECLESRIAPAGIIVLTQSGGALSITGDNADNTFTVTQTGAGAYTITGTGTTTVQIGAGPALAAQSVTGITGNLNIDLKVGNDTATFQNVVLPKNLSLNFGTADTAAQDNTLTLENTIIGGNLTVKGFASGDDVIFTGTNSGVNGSATLTLGNGQNDVDLEASTITYINGNFSFTGGIDQDELRSDDAGTVTSEIRIGGNVTVQAGAGDNSIVFEAQNRLSIGGNVSITNLNHAGTAEVAVRTTTAAGITDIGGSLTIKNGSGVAGIGGATTNTLGGGSVFSVGGSASITNGDHFSGTTQNSISSSSLVSIGNGLTIKNGAGDNSSSVSSTSLGIGGNVAISGKGGSDTAVLSGTVLDVDGGINISSGAGNSSSVISAGFMNVDGTVKTTGLGGTDVVSVVGSGTIRGALNVDVGGGINQGVTLASGSTQLNVGQSVVVKAGVPGAAGVGLNLFALRLAVNGNLSVASNTGQDFATLTNVLVKGATSIATLGGNDTVSMDQYFAVGTVNIKTGDDLDTVRIERSGAAGVSDFLKAVTVDMGTGDDTLQIGNGAAVDRAFFRSKVTLNGGVGTDTRSVAPNGNVFTVAGQPVVSNFEVGA